MLMRPERQRLASVVAAVLLATGCTTLPPNAGQDPRDPFEKVNRNVFAFNQGFDEVVLKPLAELWAKRPTPILDCLSNAFFNLRGPSTAINNTLQGKPVEGLSDLGRFVVNTTVGVVGCFDVASRMGMAIHREDFGLTLGVWGFGPGPYLVVPFFGPSSVRDAIGIYGVEPFLDLNFYIDYPAVEYTVLGLRIVNQRAELLPADKIINEAALDKYSFIRDGYLQRRRSLVYDGNPPREPDEDEEAEEADKAPASDPKPGELKPADTVSGESKPAPAQNADQTNDKPEKGGSAKEVPEGSTQPSPVTDGSPPAGAKPVN
jgi:phospholipid-binding lipoprotein MlaA